MPRLSGAHSTKNALVIRMYSVKTEEKTGCVTARSLAGDDQTINDSFSMADYPEFCIAPLVSAAYAKTWRHPHGVRNNRYVQHSVSLIT